MIDESATVSNLALLYPQSSILTAAANVAMVPSVFATET
jgi:hypothetical protein